jgi:hypothetical protein
MLRRRSSLSSLLGISASKPLPMLDETEIDPRQGGQDQRENSPQSKKMTFKSAVKVVQGALKRSGLLSRQESASTEENRNSFSRRYLLDRKASVIKDRRAPMYGSADTGGQDEDGAEDNSAQTTAEQENGSGQGSRVPFQRSPPSSGGAPSSNFLSQSLLSSTAALSPTNRSRSSQAAGSAPADQGSIPEESSGTVLALQDQINALLEQNRALQQMLQPADASAAIGSPTSDLIAAHASNQPPPPAAVKYSPEELSTLRNFTSRSNFHQNQHTLKNSQRAFSQAGLGIDGTAGMDRAAFLAARKAKQEAAAVAPVLGKQTVLDILLANTSAAPANIDAGDDYYNDTIELEPQQIEQLIELHKLQQLHLRGEARGRTLDGAAASEEGKENGADPEVMPAPPAPVRRRRDSTTSIHFRHELVKDSGGGSPGTRTAPSLFVGPEPSRSQRTESNASLLSAGTGEPTSGAQNPSAEKQEITPPGPPAAEKVATVAATSLHVSSDEHTSGTALSAPHSATQSPLVQSSPTRPVLVKAASLGAGVQQGMQRSGAVPPLSRHVSAQHVLEYITSDNESSPVVLSKTGAKGGISAAVPSSAARVPRPTQPSKTSLKTPTINERQMLHAIEREGMLLSLLGGGERVGADIRSVEKAPHGVERLHPEQRPRADSKLTSSARSTRSTSTDEEEQYMHNDTAGQGSETKQSSILDNGAELKTPSMRGKVSRMGSGVLQAAGISSSTATAGVLPKSPPRLAARLAGQKQPPVVPSTVAVASVGRAMSSPDPLSEGGDEREVGNEHLSPPRWDHKDFYQHDRADSARRASRKSGKKLHRADAPDVESKRDEASSRRAVTVGKWLDRAPPLHVLQATLLSTTLAISANGLSLTSEIALVLLENSEKSGAAELIASASNALFVSSTEEMTSIPAQGAENWWRKRIQQGGYKAAAARGVYWLALCTTSAVGDEEVLLISLAGASMMHRNVIMHAWFCSDDICVLLHLYSLPSRCGERRVGQ